VTNLFEWDDSAERSGFNRILVSRGLDPGEVSVMVRHAGTATVVSLPGYAVAGLRDALTEYLVKVRE
jgi:hypothetical protein